jgi:hypothetical protein
MDDPRVAPTLAKALGDPSPEVRRRIEEILGRFSQRDHDGNLRVLLEEAERVAASLAAEVQRLRGHVSPRAKAPPVEPIEPPPGFEGPCAVVRLTGDSPDVKRISRIVAKATARPLFGVAREMHLTKGFLARSVPAEVARNLVRELAEAGVVAGAAPMDLVPPPVEPVRLRNPKFEPDALSGSMVPSGQETRAAWDAVELVVAARIEVEVKRGGEEDWSPFTPPIRPRQDQGPARQMAYEYAIEVFAGSPVQRFRLVTHELDFEVMQRRPSEFGRVARLARELLRHVDSRHANAGMNRLADLDWDNWDDLTFLSPLGFEGYVTWQRLLLVLGVPLPR